MKPTIKISRRLKLLTAEFKSRKMSVADAPRELLVELARLRYFDPQKEYPIKNICEDLEFDHEMQVSRLLQRARLEGVIKIEIEAPLEEKLETAVLRKYRHLKRIDVVPSDSDHRVVRRALGQKMAEVFESVLSERGSASVTLGGGRTMRHFVYNLDSISRSAVITPMALFTRSAIGEACDSPFLAMVAYWKSGEDCESFICALPPLPEKKHDDVLVAPDDITNYCPQIFHENDKVREVFNRCQNPDIAIFGVADINENSPIISSVYAPIGYKVERLKSMGAVGDVNYTILNSDGEDLTREISKKFNIKNPLPKHSHPFLLAVNVQCLKELCSLPGNPRDIFVVAGSPNKFHAIRAVLKGGIANCLVTDEDTLVRLAKE